VNEHYGNQIMGEVRPRSTGKEESFWKSFCNLGNDQERKKV
jgi:hypothetical protein